MIDFLDPTPVAQPTGVLLLSRCDDCGSTAAVIDWYAGPVRCAGCWSAVCGTDPMRPIVPTSPPEERRFTAGRLPGRGTAELVSAELGRPVGTISRESSPYRVLIGAREATAGQIPAGAAAVRDAARQAGRTVRVTYALAEQRTSGRMVHSCAVRVADLGWAIWQDGRYSDAWPRVNQSHFLALATGAQYTPAEPRTPPPTGPCPRCGKAVRWRVVDGVPTTYKHQRELGGEGGRGQRAACE
jgi:ribosomal protein S27E